MLKSIFASPSKPKHSDEPMEDWYLEGLEVLENSKRVADLKKRMTQRATQQWGFYFELLMAGVWITLCFWQFRSVPDDRAWQCGFVFSLALLSQLLQIVTRLESVSIARIEASMELTQLLTKERRIQQEKACATVSPAT